MLLFGVGASEGGEGAGGFRVEEGGVSGLQGAEIGICVSLWKDWRDGLIAIGGSRGRHVILLERTKREQAGKSVLDGRLG